MSKPHICKRTGIWMVFAHPDAIPSALGRTVQLAWDTYVLLHPLQKYNRIQTQRQALALEGHAIDGARSIPGPSFGFTGQHP